MNFMKLWQTFLELIYPTCCPGCGTATDPDHVWCASCLHSIWNPRLIDSSRTPHLDGCFTLTDYEGGMRKCILRVKFGGRKTNWHAFEPLLLRFPWWERLKEYQTVVPIPLSEKKKKIRGFNQVDFMFQETMEKMGKIYMPDALVKIRSGRTQSLLTKKERIENTHGVYHINHGVQVRGKKILLVDDLYTTGATMDAAAAELKRNGAESVFGLTISSGAF